MLLPPWDKGTLPSRCPGGWDLRSFCNKRDFNFWFVLCFCPQSKITGIAIHPLFKNVKNFLLFWVMKISSQVRAKVEFDSLNMMKWICHGGSLVYWVPISQASPFSSNLLPPSPQTFGWSLWLNELWKSILAQLEGVSKQKTALRCDLSDVMRPSFTV